MSDYVIGIDGGGTRARVFAAGRNMEALYEASGGGVGLSSLPVQRVQENLSRLLGACFASDSLSQSRCRCVCLGAAGAGRAAARDALAGMLRQAAGPVPGYVTHDGAGALAGGIEAGSGILLSSGTGSICYARNARGETWRTGGWGHIMGDEGSGYDVGRKMLRAAVRAADGRDAPTQLTGMVLEHWRLRELDQVVEAVYSGEKGKSEIADLAPCASWPTSGATGRRCASPGRRRALWRSWRPRRPSGCGPQRSRCPACAPEGFWKTPPTCASILKKPWRKSGPACSWRPSCTARSGAARPWPGKKWGRRRKIVRQVNSHARSCVED